MGRPLRNTSTIEHVVYLCAADGSVSQGPRALTVDETDMYHISTSYGEDTVQPPSRAERKNQGGLYLLKKTLGLMASF